MRDWLNADLANVGGVTKQDIENHVAGSQPLEVSRAGANSDKHHTRMHGITARIRDTLMTPDGGRVTIEVHWAMAQAKTFDALDLANELRHELASILRAVRHRSAVTSN
jgi:hypothetical protein